MRWFCGCRVQLSDIFINFCQKKIPRIPLWIRSKIRNGEHALSNFRQKKIPRIPLWIRSKIQNGEYALRGSSIRSAERTSASAVFNARLRWEREIESDRVKMLNAIINGQGCDSEICFVCIGSIENYIWNDKCLQVCHICWTVRQRIKILLPVIQIIRICFA